MKKVVDGDIVKERPRADKDDWIIVDGLHEPIISEYIQTSTTVFSRE